VTIGQKREAAAWHTATGGKPGSTLSHTHGVLGLFGFPLYLTLVCTLVSRPVFNSKPFQGGEV